MTEKKLKPLVSVILPVYNAERFVHDAVSSILQQTYEYLEVLIINDGSTDSSGPLLSRFQDPRVLVLTNDLNRGLVYSLNRGIRAAKGKYIARMDADDSCLPERIAKQVEFMELNPAVGVLGTGMRQIDAHGRFLENLMPPVAHEMIKWKLFFETPIFHATVMMRRDLISATDWYSPEFIHAEDCELWCRLIDVTRFSNLEDMLYVRRWHSESISNRESSQQRLLDWSLRHSLFERLLNRKVSDEIIATLYNALNTPFSKINSSNMKALIRLLVETYCTFIDQIAASSEVNDKILSDLTEKIVLLSQMDEKINIMNIVVRVIKSNIPVRIKRILARFIREPQNLDKKSEQDKSH